MKMSYRLFYSAISIRDHQQWADNHCRDDQHTAKEGDHHRFSDSNSVPVA